MKCWLLMCRSALPQIHVHQVLIGNSRFAGQFLEVVDGLGFDADRYLPFQLSAVRVAFRFAKVVFFSHGKNSSYCFRSFFVALRAEIIRIISSSNRYAWQTTKMRNRALMPNKTNRSSSCEWSGSNSNLAQSSKKTV